MVLGHLFEKGLFQTNSMEMQSTTIHAAGGTEQFLTDLAPPRQNHTRIPMRNVKKSRVLIAVATVGGLIMSAASIAPSSAAPAPSSCNERADGGLTVGYGLTFDQRLICFKVNRPASRRVLMATNRLTAPDSGLVGIDVRPATGALFGLGDAGGVYELDVAAEKAVLKSRLNVAMTGRNFGLDFNPTVDRLRVVSDTGQNLRINVDTGAATVDAPLNFTAGSAASGVGGVAYTNNDNDASTATTLYDIDSINDQLVTQNPPNNGTLVTGPKLGFDTDSATTFDIWSDVKDGKAISNKGFVALDGGGTLFSIDLSSGALTVLGNLGADRLTGLAFPI